MSETRKAVAIAVTIEDIEESELKTVHVTGPKKQWSAAMHPNNIADTAADVVREMVNDVVYD